MTSKHFDAIIAKNNIARELGKIKYTQDHPDEAELVINYRFIMYQLEQIEAYIGEGNQPSVVDSYNEAFI